MASYYRLEKSDDGERSSASKRRRGGRDASSIEADELSADEDRELIRRSLEDDMSAFEALVEKYEPRTIRIAQGLLRDRELSRDVAQEAFVRVYRNLERYDPKHKFFTWFYRIVIHLAIDHARKQKRAPVRTWHEDDSAALRGPTSQPDGEQRAMEAETRERVLDVLRKVPPKYRALLVMRDLEGWSSKDISDVAGGNHGTVRWRLHRARSLFREAWTAAGYEEPGGVPRAESEEDSGEASGGADAKSRAG